MQLVPFELLRVGACFFPWITPMTPSDDIDKLKGAIATLTDGKLDKRDAQAVVTLLGALAGLASAAVLALQGFGIL